MNKQIQYLMGKTLDKHFSHTWSTMNYDDVTKFAEKFAELIVEECIRVPYDMWDKAELNADVAVKIEHRIKDHFGVEE